jgi:hypothetical protein
MKFSPAAARGSQRMMAGIALTGLLSVVAGCHSAFISARVTNATTHSVSLVEVDYPTASFGKDVLAAGATYSYRFKVLGSGPTKVLWTDSSQHDRTVDGPALQDGDEGTLTVMIHDTTATLAFTPKAKK